jgi:hypothetical protein
MKFAYWAALFVALFVSAPTFAQGGHCEDRCDAPGNDISGFVTGPDGAADAIVAVYDFNNSDVQSFANCLSSNLNGQRYDKNTCPSPGKAIVWAPTNAGAEGTYSMKDANGKGVDGGRYLIFVIDTGFDGVEDHSGVSIGSWNSKVVDVSGDLEYSVQLNPN